MNIYGIALVRVNGQLILKASNGKYYKRWNTRQKIKQALDQRKLKEVRLKRQ